MNEQDYETFMAMEAFGGGFVSALGSLAFKADATNLLRIKETWPEYYAEYKKLAEQDKARRASLGQGV